MVCEFEPPTDTLNIALELEEYDPSEVDVLSVELDLCPGIIIVLTETATMVDLGEEEFELTGEAINQEVTDEFNPEFWSNIENIETKDENFASISAGGIGTGTIQMHMIATTFGFNVPAEAVLKGVQIRFEAQKDNDTSGTLNWRLFLDDTNPSPGQVTQALTQEWEEYTIGSPTETFGMPEVTAAQINSNDFGVGVLFSGGSAFEPNTGRIRWVEVKAYWQYKKVWFTTSTTKTEVTDGMLDGDFRDITRIFTEANNLSPVRSTEWTLERLYTENNELSDQTRKTTLKALQEALTSTDTATKTVTRQFIENLLHEDTRANQLTRLYIETTGGMTDELRKTPIKNLLETNTLLDDLVITKELIRILTENNNLLDGDIRQTTRVLEEVLSHADIRTNASDKTLEEQNTLADIKQFMVTRTFTEEHEMEDEEVFLTRLLLLSEIMSHEDLEIETNWEIIKTYLETAQTTDAINNVLNLTKDLLEINEMLDGDFKQATRVLSEVMNTTDQVATDWTLFREFLETTEATDNVTKAFVKFLQETSEHLDVPIDRVLAKLFKPKLKLLKNIDPRIRASIEQKRKIRKAGYEDPRGKGGKS